MIMPNNVKLHHSLPNTALSSNCQKTIQDKIYFGRTGCGLENTLEILWNACLLVAFCQSSLHLVFSVLRGRSKLSPKCVCCPLFARNCLCAIGTDSLCPLVDSLKMCQIYLVVSGTYKEGNYACCILNSCRFVQIFL